MSLKCLVADDSGVMRKIIIRALNSCGVKDIVEASDGVEALARFSEQSFDLVMTDWNMPNKNGLELVQALRASGSKVPILMVTTEAEMGRVKEAIQAGVNDYLAKPFENEVLKEKIDKFACV
jgi:two-component system, chemotaxis family, chemotaxis protein CheY